MTEKTKRSAYLVVHVDTRTSPPAIVGANIYSAPAAQLTSDYQRAFPFDVIHASASAKSYADAKSDLIRNLRASPVIYGWLLKMLEERQDLSAARRTDDQCRADERHDEEQKRTPIGIEQSLFEMNRRIEDGARNIRVRRWVAEMILRHVQSIGYRPAPSEYVSDPIATLEGRGGWDADDLCAALGAAYAAAGFECRLVVRGYHDRLPSHVLLQVKIGDEWVEADPSGNRGLGERATDEPVTSEIIAPSVLSRRAT